MSDDAKNGCCGCILIVVGLPLLFGGLTIGKLAFKDLTDWRDKRLAEKAKQAEERKALDAENARVADAAKKQKALEAEIQRKQRAAAAKAKQQQEMKADKVRTFALKNAPKIWEVYQSLQSEIDVQNGKIEELRKTLEAFDKSPEQDADFRSICALRDELIRHKQTLWMKLEDAYIAAKKYEAAPSRKDYQGLLKKALEDGILEADAASSKFKEMRLNK